ncbi:MAG TPA: SDR family oxidoreductase [Bryobacteraceae bacterium]|jgi:NAD(P)-dependent dehydrogenase (short-subunit alcohol dehydrogenase family)|nr:SDR family oxidoreductase [Bryobacteraceae bacterium]
MKNHSSVNTRFLDGKRAIVTGGSRGIGFEIARALLSEGADVLITGRSHDSLASASSHLASAAGGQKLLTFACDVGKSKEVEALFLYADEHLRGGVDILVNNAGSGIFRSAAELTIEEWDQTIASNLSGAFYCTHAAIPRMSQREGGFIINISSLAGKNPFAGGAAYNASKFGLNGLSEATMLDHRHDRIRVCYIMPGSVDTGFSGQEPHTKSAWKIAPEDIADIVIGVLQMPERTLISRVEVRPSRPSSH